MEGERSARLRGPCGIVSPGQPESKDEETIGMARRVLMAQWVMLLAACGVIAGGVAGETPAGRDARMAWWRDARFGMFVHWGLYSGLAGTWDGKPVATSGGMEWIQQRLGADTETYARRAIPLFKPKTGFA